MIIATRYAIERTEDTDVFKIRNYDAPICPVCGGLCSGYDTRSRNSIDGAGIVHRFALRRLLCPECHKLHIEIPAFMRSRKRYTAEVIDAVVEGRGDSCPADDRTMRRWRRENHPPEVSGVPDGGMLQLTYTDTKEAEP